jgi:hypothetical protein
MTSNATRRRRSLRWGWVLAIAAFALAGGWPGSPFGPAFVLAGPMTSDPGGFLDFPWGSSLEGKADLSPPEGEGRVKEYELTRRPLKLGDVPVSSIKLVTIGGKFARAVVRYTGDDTHRSLLASLQRWFGALDLTPGQLAAGEEQSLNWRGPETEIHLMYQVRRERGVLFVESRALAQQFNEEIGGQ